MNTNLKLFCFCFLPSALCLPAFAQGTAFTYQGRLNSGSSPAGGIYDLRFAIYDSISAGALIAGPLTNSDTAVSNGLFTVTLDFGNQFPGANRWLEIAVRTNGSGSFFTLSPRQLLTAAPYAITAGNVVSGGITAGTYGSAVTFNNANNNFSGTFSGNGANVTNVNAASLDGLSATNFWQTGGNSGTTSNNFLGTTDSEAFEVRVDNARVLRLENLRYFFDPTVTIGAPNVIAGSPANYVVNSVGATISGGGATNYDDYNSTNSVTGDFGTVGGGGGNTAGHQSTVSGGFGNSAGDGGNAIGGGFNNVAHGAGLAAIGGGYRNDAGAINDGIYTVIGGGLENTNHGTASTIGGGYLNVASSLYATVPGGNQNSAIADYSFAAGRRAIAKHAGAFVWADSQDADFASTRTNEFLIRAAGGVGIGAANPASALHVVDSGDCEISIQSTDPGSHRYTLQSSTTNASGALPASFQIIDRTLGVSRLFIGTNGFVGIGTTSPTNKLQVVTAYCTGTSWVNNSDRNLKQNFAAVDAEGVLEKITALPIGSWSYKSQPAEKHIGPMAQDFHAAFGLGDSDRAISTVDEGGVALAAIQGLNQKLNEKDTEIQDLRRQNESLAGRLNELETTVKLLATQKGGAQ